MATQFYMQNNFTHGELDPRLFAGTNLDYYYKSLKRCRNLYVRPQGGIKKRHGLAYEFTLDKSAGEFQLSSFIFSNTLRFLLVFAENEIQTYELNTDGSIGTRRDIVTTYTAAQIPKLQFAQNGNLMVIVHPDVAPRTISWDDSGSAWNAIADLPIKNYPAYDFEKNYYTYDFCLTDNAVGTGRTLTSTVAVFEDDHVGGIFISLGGDVTSPIGLARIKSLVGASRPATDAIVDVIFPFDISVKHPDTVPGTECFLGEKAFSTNRGFPQSVTFYEDRLVFGGTPKLPQTLFMSRIGTFNDFNQGDSSDDDAIIFTLSASEYNEIEYVVSDKSLQVFCTEAEFSSMQYFAEPLTPATASFRKQSAYGSNQTKPVILDNQTFYVRVGGSSVMSFLFDAGSNSYSSQNASIFSAHLVNNPVSGSVLKGDQEEDADYMFLINEDGTLLVYQSLMQQNVSAWSLCATGQDMTDLENFVPAEGKFLQVQNVKDEVFTAVQRVIDNTVVVYIERFEFDYKTDSSVTKSYANPTNVITGLSHLIGQQRVQVIGDGNVMSVDQDINGGKVTTSGTLTLKSTAKTFDVGIQYDVLAETIPANIVGSGKIYLPKKVVRLFIDYYESLGIQVNGEYIPELTFGSHTLDRDGALSPKTGVFTTYGQSWDVRATVKITQTDPLPFLVIGLGFEVSV